MQHVIRECFVTPDAQGRGLGFFAFMAGSVLGAALQLQQAALWERAAYPALPLAAAAGWLLLRCARFVPRLLLPALLLIGAMAGAGLAGWRACAYASEALAPALEGRDLQVVGVVAQMPQRGDGAVRFPFDVESARWTGDAERSLPRIPSRIALGYADHTGLWGRAPEEASRAEPAAAPAPVHAGERWHMTVRLKAPHGNLIRMASTRSSGSGSRACRPAATYASARGVRSRSGRRRPGATRSSGRAKRCATLSSSACPSAGRRV